LTVQDKTIKEENIALPRRKWKPQGWQAIPSKAAGSFGVSREEISRLRVPTPDLTTKLW